ncbi:nucleoside-diphosphate sugar epimerase/dehydratase [Effusibacillus lacus]|uniref:Polysaccharide biosynthesis protein n=1 Tax=Effusibacillus lacus TaxID=1348429 RepID=A0A292YKF7_9BACL|nr:hypothetical protein [Effusibacillus lacus]TCS70814.1 CoA-binding protein [Effusibacillus lacus]GAX89389.1 polysaccharide biosynthesis protein [Effusibacillus lacus]
MNYGQRLFVFGLLDTCIIMAAVLFAYILRFDFQVPNAFYKTLPYVVLLHAVITLVVLNAYKMYRQVWEFASVRELISVVKAATVAEICFFVLHSAINQIVPELPVPLSIFPISWALIILGVGGSRFTWRILRDLNGTHRYHQRNTLIVGAGNAGVLVVKELKQSPSSDFLPVAFVDDDSMKYDLEIMGLPVLGGREKIPEVVEKFNIQDIMILPFLPLQNPRLQRSLKSRKTPEHLSKYYPVSQI